MTEVNSIKSGKLAQAKVPLLPPLNVDREALLPELTAAHAAIGELRGFIGSLQNPDLLIAPFRKREAVASSAIEGTRATLDEVMEYEAKDDSLPELDAKTRDIREIINYEQAMGVALREMIIRPIGENLLKKTHDTLLRSVRGQSKDRGNFRHTPVRVGDYIPPIHTDIPSLLSNWENYLNTDIESDVLIRIGVAHYQFEAIHPFLDGNGRIGRLLIPLFLFQEKMLQTPVLYISHYLEKYKVQYQSLLHNVDTKQQWNPWLKFFLKAVEEQAKMTTNMAKDIQTLYERLKEQVLRDIRSRHAIEVLDLLFRRPIITATHVKLAIRASSKVTAYNLLNKFVKAGILNQYVTIGKEKYYVFTDLRKIIRN